MSGPLVALAADLLVPSRDPRAVAWLYRRHVAGLVEKFVAMRRRLPTRITRAHELACLQIRRASAESPRALALLGAPSVGTAIRCLDLRDAMPDFADRITSAAEASVANAVFELVLRRALAPGTSIDVPGAPQLASPSLGVLLTPPPGTERITFEPNAIVARSSARSLGHVRVNDPIDVDGFEIRQGYVPLGRATRFATVDHNPIAAFEAHPEKRGNVVDLGGRTETDWCGALSEAFGIVERYLPEVFAEMVVLLHEVIPVGFDAHRHLSASYREAIGTAYVTLHPNVITMAEALVHEFQHNKLNLISFEDGLLRNAFEPRFRSPVRPDPRPLWGILLAAHAFLPVASMLRRMGDANDPRAQNLQARVDDLDAKNHEAIEMVRAHGEWTGAGRALMDTMTTLDERHFAERRSRGLAEATGYHPD